MAKPPHSRWPERTIEERFWSHVDKSGDCWLWTASLRHKGYGQFNIDGIMRKAHRVAWELTNGPIPDGLCVLHRCDVPRCVNPAHLWLGTKADNNADMHAKGRYARQAGEEHSQHKLTWENVRYIRATPRRRGCCRALASQFGMSVQGVSSARSGRSWRPQALDDDGPA